MSGYDYDSDGVYDSIFTYDGEDEGPNEHDHGGHRHRHRRPRWSRNDLERMRRRNDDDERVIQAFIEHYTRNH